MKREDILKKMKECIGTQEPIVFFEKMVDVLDLLFNQIDQLKIDVNKANVKATLAIKWEPRVASQMLTDVISDLRQNKDTYSEQLSKLKKAYAENIVTQNYDSFCNFWEDVLGYHPFLDYK
ncbi:MAG TPA: hypothetical protein VII94_02075 [Candidatus Saccharimonadales bacterium]